MVGASGFDVAPPRPEKVEARGGGPIMPNRFATLLRTSRARFSARPSGRRRDLVSACWSECCGRAQSNRRGARFFLRGASVAATQRCSRVLSRFGPVDGALGLLWQRLRLLFFARPSSAVGRAADSSAQRRLRTPSAPLHAARVAEEAKNAASGPSARPMTQPDAYGAGRGLTRRLTDPRRRRSRAVLLEPPLARKKRLSGATGSNRDRCCPTQRAP